MSSISASILLLLNNFVQISVDIWALRDKMLRDDPNQSSVVYLLASDNNHANNHANSRWINFFTENIDDVSSL